MRLPIPSALLAAMLLLAPQAGAQVLRDCDTWEASAANVAEPWARSSRTWANGAIRLIVLDTEEPACCSYHVLVQHPAPDDPYRLCGLVSQTPEGMGYGGIDLPAATASYDPAIGLTIRLPVGLYDGAGTKPAEVTITINQATGTVTLR